VKIINHARLFTGMSNTKMGPKLTSADWVNTAYSHSLQDGNFVKNPEEDIMP